MVLSDVGVGVVCAHVNVGHPGVGAEASEKLAQRQCGGVFRSALEAEIATVSGQDHDGPALT